MDPFGLLGGRLLIWDPFRAKFIVPFDPLSAPCGRPFGPFWALEGPKSRFSEIPGGTLKATVSHKVPGAPQGPPEGPPRSDFGAILVVWRSISEPLWGSMDPFWIDLDRFGSNFFNSVAS